MSTDHMDDSAGRRAYEACLEGRFFPPDHSAGEPAWGSLSQIARDVWHKVAEAAMSHARDQIRSDRLAQYAATFLHHALGIRSYSWEGLTTPQKRAWEMLVDTLTVAQKAPDKAAEREGVAEAQRELSFFVECVKALMRHTNPTNVNEGHAQQWFAVSDAIRMKIEPLISSLEALAPKPTGTEAKDGLDRKAGGSDWAAQVANNLDRRSGDDIAAALRYASACGYTEGHKRGEEFVRACRALPVAPKPTGTEAGRGVVADTRQRDMALEMVHTLGVKLGVLDPSIPCDGPQLLAAMGFYVDSLPTPPTPDSAAQGDGTSQEGTR